MVRASVWSDFKVLGIQTATFLKILGVIFDCRLSFRIHIDSIRSYAAKRVAILKMLYRINLPVEFTRQIILAFRGKLVYGLYWIYWLSNVQLSNLCSIWNRMVKIGFAFHRLVPPDCALRCSNIPSLKCFIGYLTSVRRLQHLILKKNTLMYDSCIDFDHLMNLESERLSGRTRASTRNSTYEIHKKALLKSDRRVPFFMLSTFSNQWKNVGLEAFKNSKFSLLKDFCRSIFEIRQGCPGDLRQWIGSLTFC